MHNINNLSQNFANQGQNFRNSQSENSISKHSNFMKFVKEEYDDYKSAGKDPFDRENLNKVYGKYVSICAQENLIPKHYGRFIGDQAVGLVVESRDEYIESETKFYTNFVDNENNSYNQDIERQNSKYTIQTGKQDIKDKIEDSFEKQKNELLANYKEQIIDMKIQHFDEKKSLQFNHDKEHYESLNKIEDLSIVRQHMDRHLRENKTLCQKHFDEEWKLSNDLRNKLDQLWEKRCEDLAKTVVSNNVFLTRLY